MLYIYVCEDDNHQRNMLSEYITDAILMQDCDMKLEFITHDPNALLDNIKDKKSTGLYFLDINLNKTDIDGIRLATKIRQYDPRGYIVFISAYSHMGGDILRYGTEALDFIPKNQPEQLVARIRLNIYKAYERYTTSKTLVDNTINIKSNQRDITLFPKNIIYIDSSASSHKLEIYTNDEIITTYGSLKDIIKDLDHRFFRCHKSIIINLNHVISVDYKSRVIKLTNQVECPVSKLHINELRQKRNERKQY